MMTVKDLKAVLDDLPDEAFVLQECHLLLNTFTSVNAFTINVDPMPNSHVRMVRAGDGAPALLIS
jgi:hypothetical protein